MPSIRTFIAFETPELIRQEIHAVQSEFRKINADVKWETEQKFHATIKFLGDVEEAILPSVLGSVERVVQKYSSFDVTYQDIGTFPNNARPRVIWIGCELQDKTLNSLKNELDAVLLPFGC